MRNRMSHDQVLREAGRLLRADMNMLPQMLAGWSEAEVQKLWDKTVEHHNWLKRKIHWCDRKCRRGKNLLRTGDPSKVTCKSCRKWFMRMNCTEELIEWGYLEKREDGAVVVK